MAGGNHGITPSLSILSSTINANSSIAYSVDKAGKVSIELLQLNGARAGTIMKNNNHAAGNHSFIWNGKSLEGIPINAANVYILRVKSQAGVFSRLVYNKVR